MTENPETVRLLMAAIERIDGKLEALDGKFERKMDQLNQKLDVNLRSFQDELQDLREEHTRLESACKVKGCLGGAVEKQIDHLNTKIEALQKELNLVKNSEWRIFFRQVGKVAAYIVAVGTAIVLLQQIFGSGMFYGLVSSNKQQVPVATPHPAPTP